MKLLTYISHIRWGVLSRSNQVWNQSTMYFDKHYIMATLTSQQLNDSYQSLVTIGDSITSDPTSGQLENGKGTALTSFTIGDSHYIGSEPTFDNLLLQSSSGESINISSSNDIVFKTNAVNPSGTGTERMKINGSTGDISFRDTSTNEAFYWDASTARLGIGTESPSNTLSVFSSGASAITIIDVVGGSTGAGVLQLSAGTTLGSASFDVLQNSAGAFLNQRDNNPLSFYVNNDEKIRIEADGDIAFYDDANNQGLFWDASAGSLGIGETNPTATLNIKSASSSNSDNLAQVLTNSEFRLQYRSDDLSSLYIGGLGSTRGYLQGVNSAQDAGADISLNPYGGNVGIGTNTPAVPLEVDVSGTGDVFKLTRDTGTNGELNIDFSGANANFNSEQGGYTFTTSTVSNAVSIDSSGNVGIGTDNPSMPLTVKANVSRNAIQIINGGSATEEGRLYWYASDASTIRAGIGGDENALRFFTGSSVTERMHIDSSGNVLVGTTNTTPAQQSSTTGISLRTTGAIETCADGGNSARFNRLTSNGSIVEFRKDGTAVGSIGSVLEDSLSRLYIAQSDTGLKFNNGPDYIVPCTSAGADRDNVIDLGSSSARFTDIYATNGTIQTSDINEKQDIEELDDAELRVAQKAKTLLRKFRWKSSVEENENARIHFGIIAQDLEQAFTDEGLDAGRYGMFIKSTWTNEEGEEQTRLGVRYNQLLAFIISAL